VLETPDRTKAWQPATAQQPDASEPRPAKPSIAKRLIAAAIVFVLAIEAIDEVRTFWRQTRHKATWWLAHVEQHERRHVHMEELAYLIRHLNPR
jgi:hypothetical protein